MTSRVPMGGRYYPACLCMARFGLHRVGDLACPNPKWKCGNGEPQWRNDFYRMALPT